MPARKSHGRTTATQGISLEPELLERAKSRAKSKRQSFSSYIAELLSRDLSGSHEDYTVSRIRALEARVSEMSLQYPEKR